MRSFLDVLLQMFVPTFAKTYPYHSDNDITRSLVGSTFFHCKEIHKNCGKEINLHEDDFLRFLEHEQVFFRRKLQLL